MSPAAGSPTAVQYAALTGLFIAQAIVLALFGFTAASPWLVVPTLAALGFLSFANVPGLQIYVVQLAKQGRPAAVDVASALNIAAFNLGIAAGAWIGGLVVDSPLGLGATPWVGAILVVGALALTLWSRALDSPLRIRRRWRHAARLLIGFR